MNYREKIDFSSLSTYMECPRKFLFKYMMHFRGNNKNINLIFGSCYHYALEMVYKELITNPNLSVLSATEISITAFNKLWQLEGASQWPNEDLIYPKSPGHAANILHAFWKRYLKTDQENQHVLAVEKPFLIDLSAKYPGLPSYIGRIDLIWETDIGGISIWDHKTSKALYPIALPGYEMSFQTDGYLTAGQLFFDKIPGMVYSVHLCQKTKIDFHRYYINKRKYAIEQFLSDLVFYSKRLLIDINLFEQELETKSDRNDIISCFPRCPGSACTTFMTPCRYLALCKMRNNPLLWHNAPPQGFSINEWNPETHEADLREKLKKSI